MPRTVIDYNKTIIYKLVHKDDIYDENVYTGHTTDFTNRKYQHKNSCNNPNNKKYNQKNYQYIRENGGWDNWVMIEIEKFPCKNKTEAIARERFIQTEMKAKLNTNIAGRTKKEWSNDNFEKEKETKEKHYNNNRDKILVRSKKHYQDNIENKKSYQNNYYENNKEIIKEKNKENKICDICGSIVRKYEISRHKKSNKCINNLTKY